MLRLLVLHAEALALQDHDLVVELALVEPLEEFEDVLALAAEDVPLLQMSTTSSLLTQDFLTRVSSTWMRTSATSTCTSRVLLLPACEAEPAEAPVGPGGG